MLFYRLKFLSRKIIISVSELHWGVLAIIAIMHALCTYILLAFAGENDLTNVSSFIYWYATTAFTVGYGDLSPKSELGRIITAVFIMPGAIAIFTTVLTKVFSALSSAWRKRREGMGSYHKMRNSIVLVGYDPKRSEAMVREILADTKGEQDIILVADTDLIVDDPSYRFVRAKSLTSAQDLRRAGIEHAAHIVVFAATSAETLSAALAVTALNKQAHTVCFFDDAETAQLLKGHCPHVEIVLTPTIELVVKALRDPGSSKFIAQLASHTDEGATLYSQIASSAGTFQEVASSFMENKAVLVAVCPKNQAVPHFDIEARIAPGDRLFYIARERI